MKWCGQELDMSEELKSEVISRRRALSFLGLAGALGLAVPPTLLMLSDAEAQAIPPAFNQVDKPIPGEETGTERRKPRRKRPQERPKYRHRHRNERRKLRQPGSEEKPK
jgi:hypothetical protein